MEDKTFVFYEKDERAERRERIRGWIISIAVAIAVNAGLFALSCWSVTRSIGWMFDR